MAVISPGDPLNSELIRRLTTEDEDDLMPPHKLGRPLSKAQIKLVEQWVTEGAKWGNHWSLNPIEKPSPPKSGKHSIDAFVEKALELFQQTHQWNAFLISEVMAFQWGLETNGYPTSLLR